MDEALRVALYTVVAGAAMPVGGMLARIESIRPRWLENEFRHAVIAFGGGLVLAAAALALVPHGMEALGPWAVVACTMGGGVALCLMDLLLARSGTSAAQLAAMLSDFLPEALAMGAAFATGQSIGPLLAILIACQNLPEGFNAYRELLSSGLTSRRIVLTLLALVPLGPAAGLVGLWLLAPYPQVVAGIMLFAAGGILYLTFEDIAPQAKLEKGWAPALAGVGGFLVGMVAQMLTGG